MEVKGNCVRLGNANPISREHIDISLVPWTDLNRCVWIAQSWTGSESHSRPEIMLLVVEWRCGEIVRFQYLIKHH